MKVIFCGVLLIHLAAGATQAQTFSDLQIQLGVSYSTNDGGEIPGRIWLSTGPINVGRPTAGTFSVADNCAAWSVSGVLGDVRDDATTAWNIEVTPTRVVRQAITFRLRWVRYAALRRQFDQVPLDSSKAFRMPTEDLELTLRPGESWVLDTVHVPAGLKTVEGRTCHGSASIRLSVDNYPSEDLDRRLVVADLWLVERLPNGTEARRSEVSVRGLPNRPFRFYFDSIIDGKQSLDIYGILVARPGTGAMDVSIETRCQWGDRSDPSKFRGPQRSVESVISVKPDEIVEMPLPKLGDAGPFADRQFSIRIRTRQLR
jgi:hypothetical protein